MRLFLISTCVALGVACGNDLPILTVPSPAPPPVAIPAPVPPVTSPASFEEKLMICLEKDIVQSDLPCSIRGEVVRKEDGIFKVLLGIVYQFQLHARHSGRKNDCRIFGNIKADPDLSRGIVVFNTFEFSSPSPLYLKGLLFKPTKAGNYFLYVQVTDSCDVATGVINPPYNVAITVE